MIYKHLASLASIAFLANSAFAGGLILSEPESKYSGVRGTGITLTDGLVGISHASNGIEWSLLGNYTMNENDTKNLYARDIDFTLSKKFPLKDKTFHSVGFFFEYYVNGEVTKNIGKTVNGAVVTCTSKYGADYCNSWYGGLDDYKMMGLVYKLSYEPTEHLALFATTYIQTDYKTQSENAVDFGYGKVGISYYL